MAIPRRATINVIKSNGDDRNGKDPPTITRMLIAKHPRSSLMFIVSLPLASNAEVGRQLSVDLIPANARRSSRPAFGGVYSWSAGDRSATTLQERICEVRWVPKSMLFMLPEV
jgi:hypothetical protein